MGSRIRPLLMISIYHPMPSESCNFIDHVVDEEFITLLLHSLRIGTSSDEYVEQVSGCIEIKSLYTRFWGEMR